jgi:GxxExxY protein
VCTVNSDPVCSNPPMKLAYVASCMSGEINYERQVPLPLRYRGIEVDCGYRVDLIVGGLILVEVKAVTKVLPIHRAQAMTYIKLLRLNLAFVINFNVERLNLGIYRIVMS